jgi:hypothetical protein
MPEFESGLGNEMIAMQTSTPVRSFSAVQGLGRRKSWPTFFDLLDDLACGFYGLEPVPDETFCDTIPAVCWAVPGAYASSIDG